MGNTHIRPIHSTLDEAQRRLAQELGVNRADLWLRGRTDYELRRRWIAWLTLQILGLNITQIARCCDYDHATVSHGLQNARKDEMLTNAAASIADCIQTELDVSALRHLETQARYPIEAYLRAMLGNTEITGAAYIGLKLLARSTVLRSLAVIVLEDSGKRNHAWRIDVQAHQAGLLWYGSRL